MKKSWIILLVVFVSVVSWCFVSVITKGGSKNKTVISSHITETTNQNTTRESATAVKSSVGNPVVSDSAKENLSEVGFGFKDFHRISLNE